MQFPKPKSLFVIIGTVALTAAIACGNAVTDTPAADLTAATNPSSTQSATSITRSPDAAPDFTIPLYLTVASSEGGELTLSDLPGHPVVLNFWAPLCPPCRAEMPEFEEVWQTFKAQGVQFVGVDVGPFVLLGNADQAVELLNEVELTYPVGQAQSASIVQDYGVLSMPTTVFLNADGTVHRKWAGPLNRSTLESITAELLQ
jgi:thiol-disulfide isomerase/thioredoxin